MNDESLSDDRITCLLDETKRFKQVLKPEAFAQWFDSEKTALAVEVQRYRAMLRRLEMLANRLRSPAWESLAAELRTAISGVMYLYRCETHGDRPLLSQYHAGGVLCWDIDVVRGKSCTQIARLIGAVNVP